MAKRRTTQQDDAGCGIALAVIVGLVVIALVIKEAFTQPLFGLALVAAAGGGTTLWVRRHRQRELEVQQQHQAQLAWARQQYEIELANSQQLAYYQQLSPPDFERALAFLCERDGCTQVQVVGGAGDLGADVKAIAPDGRLIVLQAKRYGPNTKVTGPDLQKFGGTCFNVHHAQVAAVVTTSVFTRQAQEYADHMRIRLVDAQALAGWASRTGAAPWH